MVTVVAIDVPVDLSPAMTQGVLTSCQNAIGDGRCVRSETLQAVPTWYAIIRSADGEQRRLRVEFRSRTSSGEVLALRTLSFSDRDPPESRWVSAGLVIAALVAAEDATPRTVAEQPRVTRDAVSAPPRPEPKVLWGIDGGALAGPGLEQGPYRWGAFGRGWVGATGSGMIGAITIRYAQRGGTAAALTWWSFAGGVGARLGSNRAPLNAELLGEMVVEHMLATAIDPDDAREDGGGQTRFGGRLGANVTVRLTTGVRVLVGVDASALTPLVDVQVKNVSVGREPAVRFAATAGLRAAF